MSRTVYKVIYFNDLGLVMAKDFATQSEAETYLDTLDFGVLVSMVSSQTVTYIDMKPSTENNVTIVDNND